MTDKDKECRMAIQQWRDSLSPEHCRHFTAWQIAEQAFQAGAAWQQSRLLEDKGLAEKVAWAITNADMEFRSTATIPHWARHLTQAAIAEIKKHMEGV